MRLSEHLPRVYANSPEAEAVQDAFQRPLDAARAAWESFLEQLDLERATWDLEGWERFLGLPTDAAGEAPFRRSRIRARLRGAGTTTVAMVKNLAESFSNGAAEIVERPADYEIDIIFTGTIGIPPNLEDLTAALEDALPAHLGYRYVITYRTWNMVSGMTWDQASAYSWGQLKEGTIV